MKKTYKILFFSMLFILMLTGCAMDRTEEKSSKPVDEEQQARSLVKGENPVKINLISGSTVIEAELDNSETSKQFVSTLPITLSMKQSDDREYYARIPKLSENGNAIPDYENGDVTYYTKGPSFAVFFAKAGKSSQGNLIRMGKVTSDLSLFEQLGNEATITIELKK